MTLVGLVVLILLVGVLIWAARYSGVVAEPFLGIATKVAVIGVVILIVLAVLNLFGILPELRRLP